MVADDDDRSGFLPIPHYFFEATLPLSTPVWIPVYGEKAYVKGEPVKGKAITDEVRDSFLGKPAFFKGPWSEDLGVLCRRDQAFTISSGSYGSAGLEGSSLEWIAEAKFNKGKKRLNQGLDYRKLLSWVDPFVAASEVDGNKATFKVYSFSEDRRIDLSDEGEALGFLCRSVTDAMDELDEEGSKLGAFL